MATVSYRRHLVTYIDVLGFRELIEKKSAGYISKIIRRLKEETLPIRMFMHEGEYQIFSDLVVHTLRIDSPNSKKLDIALVRVQIAKIAYAQAKLIGDGIIVRGALTMGEIVKSYNVLYGPALIRAYDLEREYARAPRIVVDPQLLRMLRLNPSESTSSSKTNAPVRIDGLRRDDSGLQFIDYLGSMKSLFFQPGRYKRLLLMHKRLVEMGLKTHRDNIGILSKYTWLRYYHNQVVDENLTGKARSAALIAE